MKRVAIHSAPRSGSTWLGSIFDAHPNIAYRFQPLFSYAFKGALKIDSSKEEIVNFFNQIANSDDEFINQSLAKSSGLIPSFNKEETKLIAYKEVRYHYVLRNLLLKDKDLKVIGLIRDPRAVIFSWWKAPKEFNKNWSIKEEWRTAEKKNLNRKEEYNGFLKWVELASYFLQLQREFPNQFLLIEYKELLENTSEIIKKAMHFCGIEINNQQLDFIHLSRSASKTDAYSVFKSKSNDSEWLNKLPLSIKSQIEDELANTELDIYLNEL